MKKHGPNLMIRRKCSQGAENSFPNIFSNFNNEKTFELIKVHN